MLNSHFWGTSFTRFRRPVLDCFVKGDKSPTNCYVNHFILLAIFIFCKQSHSTIQYKKHYAHNYYLLLIILSISSVNTLSTIPSQSNSLELFIFLASLPLSEFDLCCQLQCDVDVLLLVLVLVLLVLD